MSSDPVSSDGVQSEALKRRQSTKKLKSQPHPWKTIDFGGRENHELLVMLRQRELFGPRAVHARQLTRIRRSAQLNSMAASSSAKAFELVKHGVFLGLSHDSRFVVAQVKNGADGTFTSTSSLDFNFDDDDSEDTQSLVLCELSPKRLVPRVVVPMRVASLCYIYAFLPKDSSILAAMAFPCDQMAPYARDPTPTTTVQTSIELVLLKHEALHLSAKLNVLTSCRWRLPKLTRHPLRVYENGIIVNTGTTVVALRFGKAVETDFFVPSLWSDTDTCNRNMWAVTSESNVGGAALQGGMLQNLLAEMPSGDAHEPLTLRQLANGEPLHSKTLLVLTETWLEIEPIIDQVAKSVCACTDISYAGLIDYEADVLSVEDTSAGILISCVIEATPSPMLTQLPSNYLLVFDIVWNSRTAHVDHLNIWPGLRPISRAVARSPSMWYPFTSMCRKPSVEEIPLSNSPFMKGKSLERLIGYFGGISLVR